MSLVQCISGARNRISAAVHKLGWGMRVVGPLATLQGARRVLALRVRRPRDGEIALRSGGRLAFAYPSQFPTILVMFGDLIDPEFAFLRAVMRDNEVVADIGAAIGQFTLFAARFPGACIHAFEPSGSNVATLTQNVQRNGMAERVQIHQLALSNADGFSTFETTAATWMSRLGTASAPGTETVRVETLTGALARLGVEHLDVLKLNVAGYEPEVIEGAMPFLAEGRADILVMLLGLGSLPWYERIATLGYRFFYYHPGQRTLYEVTAFDAGSVLDHRPWPARHIIAIRAGALAEGLAVGIPIRKL